MNKTYRFSFLIAFFVLLQISLFAQEHKYTFGIKAGMNLASMDVRSDELLIERAYEFGSLRLWNFGVVASFDINKRFSVQPELLFTQKGGQNLYETYTTTAETILQYKMSYLALPLLLQYKIGPIKLQAGPEFSYQIANKIEENGKEISNSPFLLSNQKFDVSINIGLQFTVRRLFAQVRWQRGLVSVSDIQFTDANGDNIGTYDHYHNVLQVSLGYLFVK